MYPINRVGFHSGVTDAMRVEVYNGNFAMYMYMYDCTSVISSFDKPTMYIIIDRWRTMSCYHCSHKSSRYQLTVFFLPHLSSETNKGIGLLVLITEKDHNPLLGWLTRSWS